MKPLNLTFDAKSGNLRQLLVLFVITICIVLSRKTAPAAEPGASNAGTSQAPLDYIRTHYGKYDTKDTNARKARRIRYMAAITYMDEANGQISFCRVGETYG